MSVQPAAAQRVAHDPMTPLPYRVVDRRVETADTATLRLEPVSVALPRFLPGQFTMLCRPGVGEIAVSVSGDPAAGDGAFVQTVRDVGAVSGAVAGAEPGTVLGVRGPFGTGWGIDAAAGGDVVIVAGGVGLAPLRPVVLTALAHRGAYRRVVLVAGAREVAEFLFADELAGWVAGGVEVVRTVDRPTDGWRGPVGFVTEPLARLAVDPAATKAFLCGPEPMMSFAAGVLVGKGMAPAAVEVSLERNMKCGIGLCGHCQLGPLLVCRDGPVVDYARAQPLLTVQEL